MRLQRHFPTKRALPALKRQEVPAECCSARPATSLAATRKPGNGSQAGKVAFRSAKAALRRLSLRESSATFAERKATLRAKLWAGRAPPGSAYARGAKRNALPFFALRAMPSTRCRPASCLRRRGSPDFSPYEENCRQSGGSRSMGIPARAMRKARAGMPMLRPAGGKSRQAPFSHAARRRIGRLRAFRLRTDPFREFPASFSPLIDGTRSPSAILASAMSV